MKNLNPLTCTQIDEFDGIKNSKRTRAALNLLRPAVLRHYINYQTNFQTIHTIGNVGFTAMEDANLLTCYTGPTKALNCLIGRITKAQTTEFQYICAYCLYHTVSTVDHYIPKDEYPVFCVMPNNLLPCCGHCNSIKNDFWREGDNRLFLHFYHDIIPNHPFLTATLTFNGNTPVINYSLVQPPTVTNETFALITSHFTRLGLLELYSKGISVVISEINKSVVAARVIQPNLSIEQIREVLLSTSVNSRTSFGLNYWQAVATDLLADSAIFLQSL